MRVYCSHSIRGKHSKNATHTQMKENCDTMKLIAAELRKALPNIEFYVPAENEDFVQIAYDLDYLNEDEILDIDCKIIDNCDAVIVLIPDGDELQGGRKIEFNHAVKTSTPVVVYRLASEAIEWLGVQQMAR